MISSDDSTGAPRKPEVSALEELITNMHGIYCFSRTKLIPRLFVFNQLIQPGKMQSNGCLFHSWTWVTSFLEQHVDNRRLLL